MKRFLLTVLTLFAAVISASAVRYQGFIEGSTGVYAPSRYYKIGPEIVVSTIHGVETDPENSTMSESVASKEASISELETYSSDSFKDNEGTAGTVGFDYKATKYWNRYRTLRTAGWACFGTGMGFLVCGYAFLLSTFSTTSDSWDNVAEPMGIVMLFSCPVLVLTSIPLLSVAYYNKHKANNLKLDVGMSYIPIKNLSRNKFSSPALNFALNF